jgi:hypothetical protein
MLDAAEEKKWDLLKANCRELKVPVTELFYGIKLYDKNGIITFDDFYRGHSWTRNWYNIVASAAIEIGASGSTFEAGTLTGKRSSGTLYNSVTYCCARNAVTELGNGIYNNTNNSNYGIQVGTSNTAFSINDYALAGLIDHGSAASQLFYGVMTTGERTYDSTPGAEKWTNLVSRNFNNSSGGEITVREIGILWYGYIFGGPSYFLLERTVLPLPIAVVNGGQLVVAYQMSMSFAECD